MGRSLLVLSGGHPYEAGPFDELLAALGDWEITHLIHPEGGEADAAEAILAADALLFYDMAGYSFSEGTVTMRPPSPAFREALTNRFASGRGAVAMHHALAGWAPTRATAPAVIWTTPVGLPSTALWVLVAPADCIALRVDVYASVDSPVALAGWGEGACVAGEQTNSTRPEWHVVEWPGSEAQVVAAGAVLRFETRGAVFAFGFGA